MLLSESEKMGAIPNIGIRIRLNSVGKGKWQNSGGEKGKFGLTVNSFREAVAAGLGSGSNLLDPLLQNIETARSSGLMLGAGSVYAGSHQSELGRNLAKTEPRLANYLYSSLRSSLVP